MFAGWYEDNWYEVNLKNENISCTAEQMRVAAEGHLTTEALMWNQNDEKTISGMSSEDFRWVLSPICITSLIAFAANYIRLLAQILRPFSQRVSHADVRRMRIFRKCAHTLQLTGYTHTHAHTPTFK